MMRDESRLPRMTSFGAEGLMPIPHDFYRRFAPFMRGVNAIFDRLIVFFLCLILILVSWVSFGASLYEVYVNDGVNACHIEPMAVEKVESMGLTKQGREHGAERAAKSAASK